MSVESSVRGLASAIGVELPDDLGPDDFTYIAEQLLATQDVMTPPIMRAVLHRVRDRGPASPLQRASGEPVAGVPAPRDAPTCRDCVPKKYPGPTGLRWRHVCRAKRGQPVEPETNVVPFRRGERLGAFTPHPACKAAWTDQQGSVCDRCAPLLHPDVCECQPCVEFWGTVDVDDDRGPI